MPLTYAKQKLEKKVEDAFIALLQEDAVLATAQFYNSLTDDTKTFPFTLNVFCTKGSERAPCSNIWQCQVEVRLEYLADKLTDAAQLIDLQERLDGVLEAPGLHHSTNNPLNAIAAVTGPAVFFGVLYDQQPRNEASEDDRTRARVYPLTVLARDVEAIVATPSISPAGGVAPQLVTLACATEGADIYYTLDGSTPDATDTLYTVPFNLASGNLQVRAIGIKAGLTDSGIAAAFFID